MSKSTAYSTRMPMIVGVLSLVALVGGFGGWSVLTEISGAIVAGGNIEVEQNRQVVQHPDGGVVQDILVDEGDVVAADQVLIRLDPTALKSQLAITEGQLFEMMARRGRLEAERDNLPELAFDPLLVEYAAKDPKVAELVDGQRRLFVARLDSTRAEKDQLEKRRIQIEDQIKGLEAQQTAMGEQLTYIEEELSSQQTLLDKGLAQAAKVLGIKREKSGLLGALGDLTAQKAQAEGKITELGIEILKLDTSRREEAITRLRDQQFRELELAEQRAAILEQLSRMEIRAPVSGVVYGLTVFTPRSVIRPAEPVLYLVPQDRPLVIAVKVDPINIDEMRVGQDVFLRFSALDQKKTPELYGTVNKISADAFVNEGTGQSYYRAEILLNEGEIARLPEGETLIPGMPVEAYIKTADRTPLAYLIKPFTDYFARAFREN